MLPDVLQKNLRIIFCGTAASKKSAQLKAYYAGPGNKFWKTLNEVGLTTELLAPPEFTLLPKYHLGLTDLVKQASGMDYQIDFECKGTEALRRKIIEFQPAVFCFNGKRSAEEFLSRSVGYGLQDELIGDTKLFVAPSTSGAANGFWDINWWCQLTEISTTDD